MIRDFEPPRATEPETDDRLQWRAALGAGLIAGLVLLLVPRGSPWAALTFFTPVIMGRSVPVTLEIPLLLVMVMHMGLALLYGLLVARVVSGLRELRAVLVAGIVGLLLYAVNFSLVSLWFPALLGSELSVFFTHAVFGLIAGGAYRGLLRRRMARAPKAPLAE
jgi:hypothetical protein